jgi:hypothetical protein
VGHANASSHLQPGKTQPKKIGSWLEWLEWLDAKRPPSLQPLQPTPNLFGLCFSWLELAGGVGVPHVSGHCSYPYQSGDFPVTLLMIGKRDRKAHHVGSLQRATFRVGRLISLNALFEPFSGSMLLHKHCRTTSYSRSLSRSRVQGILVAKPTRCPYNTPQN